MSFTPTTPHQERKKRKENLTSKIIPICNRFHQYLIGCSETGGQENQVKSTKQIQPISRTGLTMDQGGRWHHYKLRLLEELILVQQTKAKDTL